MLPYHDEQAHGLFTATPTHTLYMFVASTSKGLHYGAAVLTGELGFELATHIYDRYCVVREITNAMDTDTKLLLCEN